MLIVPRESASHWYYPDGTPLHEVPRADGKGTRPTSLRDARKLGLFPSVTNVLSILAKPGLEAWKQEQAILAALTLPRTENEPLDEFARRVVADVGSQVDFRFTVLSHLDLTLSAGYALAFEDGGRPRHEAMVSLKLLR